MTVYMYKVHTCHVFKTWNSMWWVCTVCLIRPQINPWYPQHLPWCPVLLLWCPSAKCPLPVGKLLWPFSKNAVQGLYNAVSVSNRYQINSIWIQGYGATFTSLDCHEDLSSTRRFIIEYRQPQKMFHCWTLFTINVHCAQRLSPLDFSPVLKEHSNLKTFRRTLLSAGYWILWGDGCNWP